MALTRPLRIALAGSAALAVLGGAAIVAAPKGNDAQIRGWYDAQEGRIPALDAKLKLEHRSAEERARAAFAVRHAARLRARALMRDEGRQGEAASLEARDLEKYGDKDGPTFDWLVRAEVRRAGKAGPDDAVYQAIIASAQRTNALVDGWNALWR